MDQDLGWWTRIALDGWQQRPGPRYRQIAEAAAAAVQRRLAVPGDRLPPERLLADALAVSRGTVVRAYERLVENGLVERRQGAGTYVSRRPAWTRDRSAVPSGRVPAPDVELIDLSLPVPAGTGHLPAVGAFPPLDGYGHGVHPAGLPELRTALAEQLTHRLRLPTEADQLIITAGSQQALALLATALSAPGRTVLTGCPTRPGLAELVAARQASVVGVPLGPEQQLDVAALARAGRRTPSPVLYLDAAAHRLAGTRRAELLAVVRRSSGVLIEDLSQLGLGGFEVEPGGAQVGLDGQVGVGGSQVGSGGAQVGVGGSQVGSGGAQVGLDGGVPLAALDEGVVAVGSLSATFWAGLRIGWLRAPAPLHERLLRLRGLADLAPSVPAQLLARELLAAAGPAWHRELGRALRERRELLLRLLAEQLPGWRAQPSPAGLALWAWPPVADSTTFAHLAAARFGVLTTPGAAACADGRHLAGLRLGYAQAPDTLEAAVDRLRAAWEEHSRQLAASR
ncbi:PLP-dependent aminotransferase family protein [Kitasatospora acidiphila]|uniref:PLP-dependent aminotransferase family protein n=1 Tax=Kitasatospora acidiphila TaxID=2567942 RepID=A0A540W6A0_9ACTN|nr:PLP-dependent aminotransferase family protein [Kitasatospora acidiphila]TQF04539.1 PLP-dependent aminotransferase family protein [Kitasatospora acidiphila]